MVSKGIEALEFWLDPDSGTQSEPASASAPASEPLASAGLDQDPGQPKVFCQKGKCYPYDPARMKNQNINLDMKPGMILTAAEPEKSQKSRSTRGHNTETGGTGQRHQ